MNATETKQGNSMPTGLKILIGCGFFLFASMIISIIGVALTIAFSVFTAVTVIEEGVDYVLEEVEESAQADTEAFNNPYPMQETILISDSEWIVTSAEDLGSSLPGKDDYYPACTSENGKFILVRYTVENVSEKESIYIVAGNQLLLDSQRRTYTRSTDVSSCIEEELSYSETINPGIEKDFVAVYEVPLTAEEFRIGLTDSNITNKSRAYVSLGL